MHLANADSSEALKMTSIQGNNVNDNRISDTEKQFYKHSVWEVPGIVRSIYSITVRGLHDWCATSAFFVRKQSELLYRAKKREPKINSEWLVFNQVIFDWLPWRASFES